MDNAAIARVLREIADLLEIKDENPFKIRAYRNGADIASNHSHDLSSFDETGLREIPGIGKDLAARIREIATTGSATFHRELVAEFPATILDLLRHGPRTTTEIVEAFPNLTRFGVMKHIDVLRHANLVNTREEGRQRVNSLNAVPIRQIYERWVSRYAEYWTDNLLRLKEDLEK